MCPFCLATLGLIAAGAASGGGLAALVVKGLSRPANGQPSSFVGNPTRSKSSTNQKRGEMMMATTQDRTSTSGFAGRVAGDAQGAAGQRESVNTAAVCAWQSRFRNDCG